MKELKNRSGYEKILFSEPVLWDRDWNPFSTDMFIHWLTLSRYWIYIYDYITVIYNIESLTTHTNHIYGLHLISTLIAEHSS